MYKEAEDAVGLAAHKGTAQHLRNSRRRLWDSKHPLCKPGFPISHKLPIWLLKFERFFFFITQGSMFESNIICLIQGQIRTCWKVSVLWQPALRVLWEDRTIEGDMASLPLISISYSFQILQDFRKIPCPGREYLI